MNEHPNGNGNGKAFVLAQPKSPDEIARDEIRAMVPKIRRECSRDTRLLRNVGAKWLFAQLTDDSFMNCFGGDAFGKLHTTLRDLSRRYGHDEGTLSGWLKILEDNGWVWVHRRWPVWTVGISSVCRQPELFSPDHARVQARASGQLSETVSDGFAPQSDKTASYGPKSGESPEAKPSVTVSPLVSDGFTNRESRFHLPPLTGTKPGESPIHLPPVAKGEAVTDGRSNRHSPDSEAVSGVHNKETPRRFGGKETKGGGAPRPADEADPGFKSYCEQWSAVGTFRSKMEKEHSRIKVKLMNAKGEAQEFWQRRADFLRELLDGGKPPMAKLAKPTTTTASTAKPVKSKPLPVEKLREMFTKAKAAEPALAR